MRRTPKEKNMRTILALFLAATTLVLGSCSISPSARTGGEGAQCIGNYGETNAVIVVNPVVNQGTGAEISVGSELEGILIRVGDAPSDPNDPNALRTDKTGLAVIKDLPTGDVTVHVGDASIELSNVTNGELLDVAVAYRAGEGAEVLAVIRYAGNLRTVVLEPGDSITDASRDGNVALLLGPGTYEEDVQLRGNNVFVFGTCSEDGIQTVIAGIVSTGQGNTVRIRGVRVEGELIASGNNVSAAFSELESATVSGNQTILLRNTFTGGTVTVTSANALLLGNANTP